MRRAKPLAGVVVDVVDYTHGALLNCELRMNQHYLNGCVEPDRGSAWSGNWPEPQLILIGASGEIDPPWLQAPLSAICI